MSELTDKIVRERLEALEDTARRLSIDSWLIGATVVIGVWALAKQLDKARDDHGDLWASFVGQENRHNALVKRVTVLEERAKPEPRSRLRRFLDR